MPTPTPLLEYNTETDRAALLALFNSTNGDEWPDHYYSGEITNQNWGSQRPLGEWYGVMTDVQGRVTELQLCNVDLRGRIPPELGNLSELRSICLWGHGLTGAIPPELGRLSNLTEIIFSKTQITGPIPPELGNLVNLTKLHLTGGRHYFGGTGDVDDQIEARKKGQGSQGSGLTGLIPPELGKLVNLSELNLRDNYLVGPIPTELGMLTNLNELNLHNNSLTGPLPPSLANLLTLEWLDLSSNFLVGPLPDSLANMAHLKGLYYGFNESLCLPAALQQWRESIGDTYGTECKAGEPELVSSKHDRIALEALFKSAAGEGWYSSRNWLTDSPLEDWHGVSTNETGRVTALYLEYNNLKGELPPELASLSELSTLSLQANQLKGRIPSQLFQLNKLANLWTSENEGLCVPGVYQEWVEARDSVSGQYCPDDPAVFSGDLAVLVALYLALDGPNWTDRRNWLEIGPLHYWYGIETDGDGRVASLRLGEIGDPEYHAPENSPPRYIPPDLGSLSSLWTLSLVGQGLSGPIPPELAQLQDLGSLHLDSNNLSGPIPPELGNIENLISLRLANNMLDGQIPAGLGQLDRLEYLDLAGNSLSGRIPEEFSGLHGLRVLDLGGNQLTGTVPAYLSQLTGLYQLSLNDNNLVGALPVEFGGASFISSIHLHGNQLTGELPRGFAFARGLNTLSFYDNEGLCAPAWMIPELDEYVVFQGPLCPYDTGSALTDASIRDREVLVSLYHSLGGPEWENSHNWLSDELIDRWYGVTTNQDGSVAGLELVYNGLSGSLPQALTELKGLKTLNLEGQYLAGEIFPELGTLANLTSLRLRGDGLEGPIPPELGNLSNLVTLNIHGANLESPIPDEFANLTRLREVGLSAGGPLPSWLGDLANLERLEVRVQYGSGTIPKELGQLSNLVSLYLSGRGLEGTIPPELGSLDKLQHLGIHSTSVAGPIPPELGNLRELEFLELRGNQISGELPSELGELPRLEILYIQENRLQGELPSSLVGAQSLMQVLFYRNGGLCLPESMKEWAEGLEYGASGPDCRSVAEFEAEPDRETLVALYSAMGGPGWKNNENWLSYSPLETWYGVTTDEEGRVTELNLGAIGWDGGTAYHLPERTPGNNLVGEIPPELGSLSNLEVLSLRGNYLTGDIPPELGNLSKLRSLNLNSNFLEGTIPPELGHLSSLKDFSFAYNNLVGDIPTGFLDLEKLNFLEFDVNGGLCVAPPLLEQMKGFNDTVVVGPLCAAPTQAAEADRAALVAFFHSTGGHDWIRKKNWLSDVPIGSWEGVTTDAGGRVIVLNLPRNNLNGPIPPELGNLTRLSELRLFANFLTGSPPSELGNLADLSVLYLSYNDLEGVLPLSLSRLKDLHFFGYSVNSGLCAPLALQDWLQGISDKRELGPMCATPSAGTDADRAALIALFNSTGGPHWQNNEGWLSEHPVGQWEGVSTDAEGRVVRLDLVDNKLTGAIPPEVGNLSALEELELQNNELIGEIPVSFGKLTNIRKLSYYTNSSLCAPSELQDQLEAIGALGPACPYLQGSGDESDRDALVTLYNATNGPDWHYDTNWLSDLPIGDWWGVTTDAYGKVTRLRLSSNNLTGFIPPELGTLSNLAELSLEANGLSGEIPPELGNLANLVELRINSNNLSRPIPSELGNMTGLGTLVLSNNDLTGPIPRELGSLSKLTNLTLDGNGLAGPIPPELGSLSRLLDLGLSSNILTGNIPPELGSLSGLIYFQLQQNNLTGTVPEELGSLRDLQGLWIYDNLLEGQIPESFSQLTELDHFVFSENDGLCLPQTLSDWRSEFDYHGGPTCP